MARRKSAGSQPAGRGRPTTYKPEYADHVRNLMAKGFSKTAAAGSLGVSRQRFLDWAEANEDFRDAVKEGEAARTYKLEKDLMEAATGPQVTSRIFALKNAAPDEWMDRKALDHTSSDGTMTPQPSHIIIEAATDDDSQDQISPETGEAIQ